MNYNDMEELMEDPENLHKMKKYKEAIRNRNLKGVKKYFKIFGFNIYEEEDGIVTPALHYSILYDKGECDIIRFFINSGEDIERYLLQDSFAERNEYQFEPFYGNGDLGPLAYAVVFKRADAATTLLKLGANPFGKNNTLDTPMIHASLLKNEEDAIFYTFILLKNCPEKFFRKFVAQEYIDILNYDLWKHSHFNERMDYYKDYFFQDTSPKSIERRIKFLNCAEEIYGNIFY